MKIFTQKIKKSLKFSRDSLGTLVFATILLLTLSIDSKANLVNWGTLSSSTTWTGTCTSSSCSTRGGNDVQYQFVAGVSGSYTFATCGVMSNDTYLYLSTGSCYSGTTLAANDDGCSSQSTVTYNLTAGTTYYLLLEAYSGSLGAYTITVTVPTVLAGENCSNAQNLASLSSPYSATTAGYADDFSICRSGYPDRIFYIDVPMVTLLISGNPQTDMTHIII